MDKIFDKYVFKFLSSEKAFKHWLQEYGFSHEFVFSNCNLLRKVLNIDCIGKGYPEDKCCFKKKLGNVCKIRCHTFVYSQVFLQTVIFGEFFWNINCSDNISHQYMYSCVSSNFYLVRILLDIVCKKCYHTFVYYQVILWKSF